MVDGRLKKLLLLLFSLLLSFNSFGGSVDGKGLRCEIYPQYSGETIYMWFEDGFFAIPEIEGSKISWTRYTYTESGTKKIYFNKESRFFSGYPYDYLKDAELDRETLLLKPSWDSWELSKYKCSVLFFKESIIIDLQRKINDAKSTNQI